MHTYVEDALNGSEVKYQ